MRIRLVLPILAFLLAGTATFPRPVLGQSASAAQVVFLGDKSCGDSATDCAFPLVTATHRYLHVIVHDQLGDDEWRVQVGPGCAEGMATVIAGQPVPESGYVEVVADIGSAGAAGSWVGRPGCYVFRGMDGYYITFYAAYFDDTPAPDAETVFPMYQTLAGRPDLPDLDVTYIHRDPQLMYDGSPNTPARGQMVTFTAHVLNAGGRPLDGFGYQWIVDGVVVSEDSYGQVMNPDGQDQFTLQWRWDDRPHDIRFQITTPVQQISTANDGLTVQTNALALGFWVERSAYNYFRTYQWYYCQGLPCAGSNSFEDWLQRQVRSWNDLLQRSGYPGIVPTGVADRIRLDSITVVPDGALPLSPLGVATNAPDPGDRFVDLQWGMPAAGVQKSYGHLWDGAFDVDWSMIHELNHARSLADLYRFDVPIDSAHPNPIEVDDAAGHPVFDPSNPFDPSRKLRAFVTDPHQTFVYQNKEQDLMSCPCTPSYSMYTALTLNRIRNRRALCGNSNPPCNLGDWFLDIPPITRLRILDRAGAPVPDGSRVRLFFDLGTTYSGHVFSQNASQTLTTIGGAVSLGSDPFHSGGSAGTAGHNLLLIEVQVGQEDDFCFQEPTDFNMAYWMGYRDNDHPAVLTLRLGNEIRNGCNLELPQPLLNEPFATSPYNSRVSLVHKSSNGRGRWVLRVTLLDDGSPPLAMWHRLVIARDQSGKQVGSGMTGREGIARLVVPGPRAYRIDDVTDNHLAITAPVEAPAPRVDRRP